ncbi:hypothetical protein BHE74_00032678 [Ensete ventricosum]|nr:hypothetical protein BHE74_00032678 [Ensete ventricosum]
MKRRPMLQLEGNNDDGKDREEGTKMRATTVVATHAGGRRRVTVGVEKHGRKKAATMLRKREQGRRGRAVEAMVVSDRGRLKERVVAVAAGATTGKGHRHEDGEKLQQGDRCNDDDDDGKGDDKGVDERQ